MKTQKGEHMKVFKSKKNNEYYVLSKEKEDGKGVFLRLLDGHKYILPFSKMELKHEIEE